MDRLAPAGPGSGKSTALAESWIPGLWLTWVLAVIALVLIKAPTIVHFDAYDPDDYTRLLQVRDWLAGQAWYDTQQYRWNPPYGGNIHWVRLGDLPMAAILYPLHLVLTRHVAEMAAMTIVPLLELLLAMALMRHLMRRLALDRAAQFCGLVMLTIFPMLISNFAPLRIDYHAWLGVCALAMACLAIEGRRSHWFAAGALGALALTLSLECMPFVLGFGGLLVARYWWEDRRDHVPFFVGLALTAPPLTLAFRSPSAFFQPYCDVLSAPYLYAFASTALMLGVLARVPGLSTRGRRLAALLPVPAIAAWLILKPLGLCALVPLANVDPLVNQTYFDAFVEAAGIGRQQLSVQVLMLWTFMLAICGGVFVLRQTSDPMLRERWTIMWGLALLAATIGLVLMRAGITAEILVIPFCAALVVHFLPRARAVRRSVPRIAATLACLGLVTPILATALALPFDRPLAFEKAGAPYVRSAEKCDFARLNALPQSRLFTPISISSKIMAISPHSTVAGTYHRDDRQIRDVIIAFTGPADGARAILQHYGSGYLTYCDSDIEVGYLASKHSDSLARQLVMGRAPAWLESVNGFENGPLRVYRVR